MNLLTIVYILFIMLLLILIISLIYDYIYIKKTNNRLMEINKDLITSYNRLLEKYKENNFYEQEKKKVEIFNSYIEYIENLKK